MILLDPHARPVIAHRGNRAHAPENTIESFLEAVQAGADAIELDLRLTRDGEVVVIHDATVDRTTDASGRVEMKSLEQLQELDAGARFSNNGGWSRPYFNRGITIPTLHEVIDALPKHVPLILELKTSAVAEPVKRIIADRKLHKRVLVAGFQRRAIHPLHGSGFAVGATTTEAMNLLWPAFRGQQLAGVPFDALCIPPRWRGIPVPIAGLTRTVRQLGKVVHIWTINRVEDARRLWEHGVHGLVTDDPVLIRQVRDQL